MKNKNEVVRHKNFVVNTKFIINGTKQVHVRRKKNSTFLTSPNSKLFLIDSKGANKDACSYCLINSSNE